jgi:hypothetical protein
MPLHIGQLGTAVGPLRPVGEVDIAGKRYPARTDRGPIDAGRSVIITGADAFDFTVRDAEGCDPASLPDAGKPLATRDEIATAREDEQREDQRRLYAEHRVFIVTGLPTKSWWGAILITLAGAGIAYLGYMEGGLTGLGWALAGLLSVLTIYMMIFTK